MSNLINFTLFKIEKVIKLYSLRSGRYRWREQRSNPCGESGGDTLGFSALASRRFVAKTLTRTRTIPLVTEAIKIELSVVS